MTAIPAMIALDAAQPYAAGLVTPGEADQATTAEIVKRVGYLEELQSRKLNQVADDGQLDRILAGQVEIKAGQVEIKAMIGAVEANSFRRRLNGMSMAPGHQLQPLQRVLAAPAAPAAAPAAVGPQPGQEPAGFPQTREDIFGLSHAAITALAEFYGVDFGTLSDGVTTRRALVMAFLGC